MRRALFATSTLFLLANAAAAQFSYTGFGAASWSASDADLGIAGAAIEDFEDTSLLPGLKIGVSSGNGNRAPSNTLPNLFNDSMDGFGSAFANGTWDGQFGLISTRDNASHQYNDPGNWGIVTFQIDGGATLFGFSLQNMEHNSAVLINGQLVGTVNGLFGVPSSSFRNGYCIIRATGNQLINEVIVSNSSSGDGYMFDHVAIVPTPGAASVLGLTLLGLTRRRGR